jgi:NADH:ubiquinone oxidoreductase subunit K
VFAIFVIAVAAAEAAVGLGIILAFYRNKETINNRSRGWGPTTN